MVEEARRLVDRAGNRTADLEAAAPDLQADLEEVGLCRRELLTLDYAGIPTSRKQRWASEVASQTVALQTIEDILRLRIRAGKASRPRSSSVGSGSGADGGLVVAAQTAAPHPVPAQNVSLTSASLTPAGSTPSTANAAQTRLMAFAGLGAPAVSVPGGVAPGGAVVGSLPATTAAVYPAHGVSGGNNPLPSGFSIPPPALAPPLAVLQQTPAGVAAGPAAPFPVMAPPPTATTVAAGVVGVPRMATGGNATPLAAPPSATAAGGTSAPPAGAAPPASAGPSASAATAAPWATPVWGLGAASPFDAQTPTTTAWYLSFPHPWNVVPVAAEGNLAGTLKIAPQALPRFGGDRRGYLVWRQTFIPCVHRANIDIQFKIMLLRATMEPRTARMRDFIDDLISTPEGYKLAVCTLEDRYGGREAVLLTRQDALMALPEVKEGEFRTLEMMHSRLGSFMTEWAGISGTGLDPSESLAFYTLLMNKIDGGYSLKYHDWLLQVQQPKGVQSLYVWLGQQLANHRSVDMFLRRRRMEVTGGINRHQQAQGASVPRPSQKQPRHQFFLGQDGEVDAWGESCGGVDPFHALLGEGEEVQEGAATGGEAQTLFYGTGSRPQKPVPRRRPPCPLCAEDHGLGRCSKFQAMTPTARKEVLVKERRCYLCFQAGHNVGRCRVSYLCAHCQKRHHTMLHGAEEAKEHALYTQEDEEGDFEGAVEQLQYGLKIVLPEDKRVSLRTIPLTLVNPHNGKQLDVNALLDDGCSTAAMVSQQAAGLLALAGPTSWTNTEGVGGVVTEFRTITAIVEIRSKTTGVRKQVPAQVMTTPAGSYVPVNWKPYLKDYPHLKQVEVLPPVPNGRVDVLLGSRCPALMASLREVVGGPQEPVARLTPLGWTVTGPTTPAAAWVEDREAVPLLPSLFIGAGLETQGSVACLTQREDKFSVRQVPSDKQLVQLVQRMLEVEDPGELEVLSPKEEYIIKKLRASLRFVEGKYEVACTWRPGAERPPLNEGIARGRLLNLEKSKAFKDPAIRAAYGKVFSDWEGKKIVQRVPLQSDEVKHLLPHFPILKESETTPVRPVMGCDVALNRFLLPGPNLLNEVVGVLLRFRSGRFTIAGDIKQMFLNIRLLEEDRPFHCFLWKGEEDEPFVYQFQRHVFGNAGSPCVAVFVLKEHARKYQDRYPKAVDTLLHSTLIDDVLDAADTEEEAGVWLMQIREIITEAGMTLAKIHSNAPKLLEDLPREAVAAGALDLSASALSANLSNLKTLGLAYDPVGDEFFFRMDRPHEKNWTKRKVLKLFPRLFDPLGLLLPFTIKARIYFSLIARGKYAWDEELPLSEEWEEWLRQLAELEGVRVRRNVRPLVQGKATLHVFADASKDAYAAVAYLSVEAVGKTEVALVFAKAHVAPAKTLTIPRMELLAALLAVKVRQVALYHLKHPVHQVMHWSDSLTVLFWLNDDSQRFQAFVYNKLNKIRQSTCPEEWRWVPTEQNPADWATRGKSPTALVPSSLWLRGPPFLREAKECWPPTPALVRTSEVLREMKKTEQVFMQTESSPPTLPLSAERCGTWKKALSFLVKLLRWRDTARSSLRLAALEPPRCRAEKILVRVAQWDLHKALQSPLHRKITRRQHGLLQLEPFLDEEGLIRGKGRLSQARALPRDAREPLLLPPRHPLTVLLIRHTHEEVLKHAGGVSYTLNHLRARFWLPQARQQVHLLVSKCVPCRRRIGRVLQQRQGQLPTLRFPQPGEEKFPFAVTAVDCAGPFRVKRGRSYETHYLLLLTCCHVRAVRLELLSDLTTDAFLMALMRAGSHGVNPHTILSDNGGNFDGANRLLRTLWSSMPQEELERKKPAIKWRFNPPYASHYGGVFERLIGAAKAALHHALPAHQSLSLEQLLTAFAVVEGILNARPLAYLSAHAADPAPLTPNHFLGGGASRPWITFLEEKDGGRLARRWEATQRLLRTFWARFHKEVIPHLLHTTWVRGRGRPIKEGDVVAVFLPSGERRWPLGRVLKCFPGPDGLTRTVELRVSAAAQEPLAGREPSVVKRDIRQLVLLLPAEETTIDLI